MGARGQDGFVQYRRCVTCERLTSVPAGVARLRWAGLPKAEPGAGAGPAAPQAPP
jgi:hypothetical protein